MKTSFDVVFVGKFELCFLDSSTIITTIERYGVDSKGGIIYLLDENTIVYNWSAIAYMKPVK